MGTSATQAKAKYNRKNYDTITIRARKGANDAVNELARLAGRSKSDYVRSLISTDARRRERYDLAKAVGGGGVTYKPAKVAEPSREVSRFLEWLNKNCFCPKIEQEIKLNELLETLATK